MKIYVYNVRLLTDTGGAGKEMTVATTEPTGDNLERITRLAMVEANHTDLDIYIGIRELKLLHVAHLDEASIIRSNLLELET